MEMEWEETIVCQRCGVRTTKRKKEVGLFCSLGEDLAPTSLQELIQSSAEPETIDRTCEVFMLEYQDNFINIVSIRRLEVVATARRNRAVA